MSQSRRNAKSTALQMLFEYFSRACRRREVIGFLNPSFLISSSNFATKSKTDSDNVCDKTKKKKKKSKAMLSKEKKSKLDADWLRSLSPPMKNDEQNTTGNGWILGIDPDNEGAIAVLKPSTTGSPDAQVYDTPTVKLMFTKTERNRLDVQSIISLLQSFDAPQGSMAYIEAAGSRPHNSRPAILNMGFSYGIWVGILVSSGFSVFPVSSHVWKKYFCLPGGLCNKDESRALARHLFPSLSLQMNRKKDHGRAEALLIAAYGSMITYNENERKYGVSLDDYKSFRSGYP